MKRTIWPVGVSSKTRYVMPVKKVWMGIRDDGPGGLEAAVPAF